MTANTLKELYVDELRDLYDGENQLIKALPNMAKKAAFEELRTGIEKHLEQTKEHAKRIEQIFEVLGESLKGTKCKGMQGILSEGYETLREGYAGAALDSAIIASAQRVEHYEIAGYGTVREFAERLGEREAASLLAQTLAEEKETDRKLTEIAQAVNQEAAESEEGARPKRRARTVGA
jgi:ferritin-like metal-binding protein YciE